MYSESLIPIPPSFDTFYEFHGYFSSLLLVVYKPVQNEVILPYTYFL